MQRLLASQLPHHKRCATRLLRLIAGVPLMTSPPAAFAPAIARLAALLRRYWRASVVAPDALGLEEWELVSLGGMLPAVCKLLVMLLSVCLRHRGAQREVVAYMAGPLGLDGVLQDLHRYTEALGWKVEHLEMLLLLMGIEWQTVEE